MRTAIKNSLIYAVVLTGAQVVLGLPLAVILNMKLRTGICCAQPSSSRQYSPRLLSATCGTSSFRPPTTVLSTTCLLRLGCRLLTFLPHKTHFILSCSRRSGSGPAGRWSSSSPTCRAFRAICMRQPRLTVPAASPAFSVSRCR